MLTREFILAIAPAARPSIVDDLVRHGDILTEWDIVSDTDICYFLGQCATETSGFNRLEESLYYTTVKRIRQVWPSRFKSDAAALPYVRQPEKLANFVYGGRYGNTSPMDGWLYRGSGCKGITFKANYAAVEKATGIRCIASPQLLRSFPAALKSACVYWSQNKLSRFAVTGDVKALTKAVQGGTGGLADRITYTNRALKAAKLMNNPKPDMSAPLPIFYRNGSPKSVQVEKFQARLLELGYRSVGNIDGVFGDATEDAVKLFQRANGLIADGVIGAKTIAALNAAKPSDYRDPTPDEAKENNLPKRSGLDNFLLMVIGWFRSIFERWKI